MDEPEQYISHARHRAPAPESKVARCAQLCVFTFSLGRGSPPATVSMPPAAQAIWAPAPLLHADQIDFEHQRGARRDVGAGAVRAIAQVRRNDQRALAAYVHGGEAFVPALDDLA